MDLHNPEPPRRASAPFRALARGYKRLDAFFERLEQAPPQIEKGLETCEFCGQDFVNPVDWEPVDEQRWWMLLRCGACETFREVTVDNEHADRFDQALDRRMDVLAASLNRLDLQRMAEEAEAIIGALRHGLIDAADFAR